eukprot:358044-Chlamydomonas_euryale.AAC.3
MGAEQTKGVHEYKLRFRHQRRRRAPRCLPPLRRGILACAVKVAHVKSVARRYGSVEKEQTQCREDSPTQRPTPKPTTRPDIREDG